MLVGNGPAVCVCIKWRRLYTAGAVRQWRTRLEEGNHEARQLGAAVLGGIQYVGLRARALLAHSHGYPNALSAVGRTAVLAEVVTCINRSLAVHLVTNGVSSGTLQCTSRDLLM